MIFKVVYSLGQDDLTFSEGTRKYQALQLHFHWASATFSNLNKDFAYIGGSEHTVNNHHYPIEVINLFPSTYSLYFILSVDAYSAQEIIWWN